METAKLMRKCLGIVVLSLLACSSVHAAAIFVDPTEDGSHVYASITDSKCLGCFVDAAFSQGDDGLEAAGESLEVGDYFSFNFFDLTVGGLFGGAEIAIDAKVALDEPVADSATGTGFGGFASFFFFFNGVQLSWIQPEAIELDDGTFLGVSFEDLYEFGIGNTFTVQATITRFDAAPVPEPGTAALLMIGLFALWFASRQRPAGRLRFGATPA